jgi:hypothetical protein
MVHWTQPRTLATDVTSVISPTRCKNAMFSPSTSFPKKYLSLDSQPKTISNKLQKTCFICYAPRPPNRLLPLFPLVLRFSVLLPKLPTSFIVLLPHTNYLHRSPRSPSNLRGWNFPLLLLLQLRGWYASLDNPPPYQRTPWLAWPHFAFRTIASA